MTTELTYGVSIIEPYHSHAMLRHLEPFTTDGFVPDHVTVHVVDSDSDVDPDDSIVLHVPWHTLVAYDPPVGQKQVMVYTHCNPGAEKQLRIAAAKADHIICVSHEGQRELATLRIDKPSTVIELPAADRFIQRKINIGVIGAEQPNGRKRSWLLIELAWRMDLTPFKFYVVGGGWKPVLEQLRAMGISVESFENVSDEQVQEFYHLVDVVLVTAFREGGPLPVTEALASGTPLLSPPYGLAADLLPDEMLYRSDAELMEKLERLTERPAALRAKVAHLTAERYASEHFKVFDALTAPQVPAQTTISHLGMTYAEAEPPLVDLLLHQNGVAVAPA